MARSAGRPTRFCWCGEYVADRFVVRIIEGQSTTVSRLVHIDADGNRIHRAHLPVEQGKGK